MKELPEAARVIVERARDAHDPSDAQLQNMLGNLHARLGYAPAPSEPDAIAGGPGRTHGLLQARLLKLALSLAAVGGIAALVLPRLWHPEPVAPAPAVVQLAEPRDEATPPPLPMHDPVQVEEPAAPSLAPERRAEAPARPRAPSPRRPSAAPARVQAEAADVASNEAQVTPMQTVQVSTPAVSAVIEKSPESRVLLSDVVPLQTPRSRAQAQALTQRGASGESELALIDRAASLLRDGDHSEALELLQEHGRKFPTSQLKIERQGLSVLARCGAGQIEQGRRERAEFLRDAGQAPLAARVRRACAETKP